MPNKEPTNILEELKFVEEVWKSVNEARANLDRIAQTLSFAQIEIEKLRAENKKLKRMLKAKRPKSISEWTQNGGKF